MRPTIVLALILAFVGTPAHAVEVRSDGEVLVFPFFGADNGWDSLIDISIGPESAILKIRVRDGVNGAEVGSFNVYGFGNDGWRASISKSEAGSVQMRIAEGSCTIGENLHHGGVGTVFPIDADVGTLEVYAISGRLSDPASMGSCADLAARWGPGGVWRTDASSDLVAAPAPRISGELTLVRVADGLAASLEATALHNFSDSIPHTAPWSASPNLAEADPVAKLPGQDSAVVPTSGLGVDAVATVLGLGPLGTVANDVVTLSSIDASTDWVLSYPLDGYRRYRPFTANIGGEERGCETLGQLHSEGEPHIEIPVDHQALRSWGGGDYKDQHTEVEITPAPTTRTVALQVCHAVNVLAFEGRSSVLVSGVSPLVTVVKGATAAEVSMLEWKPVHPVYPAQSGIGRPVLGFRLTTFINGTLDEGHVLANYATLKPHSRR
jgi:hypothetical protein